MAVDGAVQLSVVINGQSFSISKKNLVSFNLTRVIGDSADKFTLEAFDETAWQLENALMGKKLADISVQYSVSDSLNKNTITFKGTCITYQLAFVGKSTMLTIEGIVADMGQGGSASYWFEKNTINWCGTDPVPPEQSASGQWEVDGKKLSDIEEGLATNEDICAKLVFPDGNLSLAPEVYFNPSRIFKRIIRKYNGDVNEYGAGAVSGGNGYFKIGQVDQSLWIKGLDCTQVNKTAAEYITDTLCKNAVYAAKEILATEYQSEQNKIVKEYVDSGTSLVQYGPSTNSNYLKSKEMIEAMNELEDNKVKYEQKALDLDKQEGGFKYTVDGTGHNFKNIGYTKVPNSSDCINVSYGLRNSTVISFALSNVGTLAMTGVTSDENGNPNIDISGINYFTGDNVRAGAVEGSEVTEETQEIQNWFSGKVSSIYVSSSTTSSSITSILSNTWSDLNSLTVTATISLWGQYSKQYTPGNYIYLTVEGNNKNHYSTGTYIILEITDAISSDGYIQTMKLMKIGKSNTSNSVAQVNSSAISTIAPSSITLTSTANGRSRLIRCTQHYYKPTAVDLLNKLI